MCPFTQERGALVAAEPPDHVASGLVRGLRDPGERVVPDAVRDGEALHLQAEALQLPLDNLLGFLLAANGAGCGDEQLQEGERVPGARHDLGV